MAGSNTISEAPEPTIFVPMPSNWKKLVCDGSMLVGPEGNIKSTLEICPVLTPCQRLLFASTPKISSNEHLVAKTVKVPFHVCPRLVQSRVETVVVANLQTFPDYCLLATLNLYLSPKGNTERSISASKLHRLSERDHTW